MTDVNDILNQASTPIQPEQPVTQPEQPKIKPEVIETKPEPIKKEKTPEPVIEKEPTHSVIKEKPTKETTPEKSFLGKIIPKKIEVEKQTKSEEEHIKERQQEVISYIKAKKDYIPYIILTFILYIAYKIRTSNLHLLTDTTTEKLVPLALDPHIFLRYARYLLYHGTLNVWDKMRYVPYGFDPRENLIGVSYFSVYFYKIVHFFDATFTLDQAHIFYPPIAFIISMVIFYFLIKKIFNWKVSLLATATLSFIPTFLQRTMAGFSDKEALGFLFYFLIFFLYISALDTKKTWKTVLLGALAGLSTGLMALTWGGVKFIYLTIGGFTLLEILLNRFKKKEFFAYTSWFALVVLIVPILNPVALTFRTMFTSFTTSIMTLTFIVGLIYYLLFEKKLLKQAQFLGKKLTPGLASLLITALLGIILLSAMYGPSILPKKAESIYTDLISPFGKDRWQLTVAENHQPFTTDWTSQMGWLYVFLFLVGAIYLFYKTLAPIKEDLKDIYSPYTTQLGLTIFFALFLYLFSFSRYSRSATYFNGTSTISKIAYIGSITIFGLALIGIYIYSYYTKKSLYHATEKFNKNYLFILVWFIIMLVAARSAVRLLMVLAPVTAILSAYLVFEIFDWSLKFKDKIYKYALIAALLMLVLSPYALGSTLGQGYLTRFYQQTEGSAKFTGPSYNQQWQQAGQWTRENTPTDSVFIHWWDYGYWVQNGFNRATVTDGGNAHGYLNYQVGRHVLTAQSEQEALEVMYAHNASYFLIISDEIGKYTAYSSIGADEDYDRYSWITNFQLDPKQTQEKRDETVLFYKGSYVLDDDFTWNGELFPKQASGIGGVFLPIEDVVVDNQTQQKIKQPTAALFKNGKRTDVPIECLYMNNVKTEFDNPGLKSCFRIIPAINNNQINPLGAGLYVSEEGVNALWTQLFLFNRPSENFELVYDDSDRMPLAIYQGRQIGPLRIWKINYPDNFTISEEKLKLYQGFAHENQAATII